MGRADTVAEVLQRLEAPLPLKELRRPIYERDQGKAILLGVEGFVSHITSEGYQLEKGMCEEGFDYRPGTRGSDIAEIEKETNGRIWFFQDVREWNHAWSPKNSNDASFKGFHAIKTRHHYRFTVLKDAHAFQHQYAEFFANKIRPHAWMIYYHPAIVKHLAPFVRLKDCIRIYHSVDINEVPPIGDAFEERERRSNSILLSGNVHGGCYPLRHRLEYRHGLWDDLYVLKHPDHTYRNRRCYTPQYLKTLSNYKVHIATASRYGYALRKIIESVACGVQPITNLPVDDELPFIDDYLIRVPTNIDDNTLMDIAREAVERWDADQANYYAIRAKIFYDYRKNAQRMLGEVEKLRKRHAKEAP